MGDRCENRRTLFIEKKRTTRKTPKRRRETVKGRSQRKLLKKRRERVVIASLKVEGQ